MPENTNSTTAISRSELGSVMMTIIMKIEMTIKVLKNQMKLRMGTRRVKVLKMTIRVLQTQFKLKTKRIITMVKAAMVTVRVFFSRNDDNKNGDVKSDESEESENGENLNGEFL